MVLVKTRDGTFDMDPEWLPMFYNRRPFQLPIRDQATAAELVKYVREEEKKIRMFGKIRRSDRLDAYHTGLPFRIRHEKVGEKKEQEQIGGPRPRTEIDIRMEQEFATSFRDFDLLYAVARGARKLFWTTLFEAIFENEAKRLAAIGFNGSHSLEYAKDHLFFEILL